jgi:hypothetical protein
MIPDISGFDFVVIFQTNGLLQMITELLPVLGFEVRIQTLDSLVTRMPGFSPEGVLSILRGGFLRHLAEFGRLDRHCLCERALVSIIAWLSEAGYSELREYAPQILKFGLLPWDQDTREKEEGRGEDEDEDEEGGWEEEEEGDLCNKEENDQQQDGEQEGLRVETIDGGSIYVNWETIKRRLTEMDNDEWE